MASRKVFERELITKLNMKTVGNQTPENVLLKSFKYFDLGGTCLCDCDMFIKTMLKIGITGYTNNTLQVIFDVYVDLLGGDNPLNYKDLIGILFMNASLMDNPYKLKEYKKNAGKEEEQITERSRPSSRQSKTEKENQRNNNPDYILETLRDNIKRKGIRSLILLETIFRNMDDDNSQLIDIVAFSQALHNFDLNNTQIKILFEFLDKEKVGKLDYDEFLREIRGVMNDKRRAVVEQIFESLNPNQNGIVSINTIFNKFNAGNHPDAISNKRSENVIYAEFNDSFQGNHVYLNGDEAAYGNVDIEEFIDYYDIVSFFIVDDNEFIRTVKGIWSSKNLGMNGYDEEPQKQSQIKRDKNKRTIDEDNYSNHSKSQQQNKYEQASAMEMLRNYMKLNGSKYAIFLAKQFKTLSNRLDYGADKLLDYDTFNRAIITAKLDLAESLKKQLFDENKERNDLLNYESFLDNLIGNMNERRMEVVVIAFNRMDIEKSGIVDFNELKYFYTTKNNPQVASGDITEEELYSHFIETFTEHHYFYSGIRDKRVTLDEFIDYYRFCSFCIPSDELFEQILIAAWKLENVQEYNDQINKENELRQKLIEKNIENKQEECKNQKPYMNSRGCPYGVDNEPTDYSTSLNNRLPNKNKKGYNDYKDNRDKSQAGSNYEPSVSHSRHTEIEEKSVSTNACGNTLETLSEIIMQRGTRGIMSMRRCFMIYDENNNRLLSLNDFIKYLDSYLIPINKEDAKRLFMKISKGKDLVVNYDDFINLIVPPLSPKLQNLVVKAFNNLDKTNTGVVKMGKIRTYFKPKNHPDVVNGTKNSQEILSEFLDNFDYHFKLLVPERNPEDDEVTLDDFIDFYRYISFTIKDDYYFNSGIEGVWGI